MEQGLKDDGINGKGEVKLRWDLLPIECVEEVVKVLTFGAKKYAPNNWQKVPEAEERYYAACMRHLTAWRKGETVDEESGLSHLSHLMCDITFLLWFEKQRQKQTNVPALRMENTITGTNAPHLREIGTSAVPVVKEN